MALSIKNPVTEDLARRLAEESGESLTQGVTKALEERLAQFESAPRRKLRREAIRKTLRQLRELPVRDRRSSEEILGYDEHGLP